jgi:NAD(P)-dependent dehydrogenase (short-subunit alcohol dehydrogenase family)
MQYTNQIIIVTGCGYKKLGHTFMDFNGQKATHLPLHFGGSEYKLNIGSSTALELVRQGYRVIMIGRNLEKLEVLRTALISQYRLEEASLSYAALDLTSRDQIRSFLATFDSEVQLHWVNSVGLGAGDLQIVNDNPYLQTMDIDMSLIKAELSVVEMTFIFLQEFLTKIRSQTDCLKTNNKIVIVSSMSAIRSLNRSSAHAAGKGAVDRYANAIMLELWRENIHVSTIRPGAIDTGLYDNAAVQKEVYKMDEDYGSFYNQQGRLILANPISVAKVIEGVLSNEDFVASINLVANGQFPNQGS